MPEEGQRGAFQLHHLGAARIAAADQVGDPAAIGIETLKIDAATQQQRLDNSPLEVAVLALDGAIFVRHPGVIAGWCHAVMGAQRLIATRLIEPSIVIEIAKCRREAVGTMLERHPAEREERVLQVMIMCP